MKMKLDSIITYCNEHNIQYVLIDFFNTIVSRTCAPDEIKRLWAKEMSVFLKGKISNHILYECRRETEKFLVKYSEKNGEFLYGELIGEIYRRLSLSHPEFRELDLEHTKFQEMCYKIECECEINVQKMERDTERIINDLYENGKKIVIVSDFYMDSETIKKFLKAKKIDMKIYRIFVSSELGLNKSTGTVYAEVLKRLGVTASECIMIGDNHNSDIINAKKNGIVAFKREANYINEKEIVVHELNEIYKMARQGKVRYSNYSFMLYLFVERLYFALLQAGITTVYFLSREGEMLKQLFDIYCESKKWCKINSKYLYVSRKATYSATLIPLEKETFEELRKYKQLCVSNFLENLSFNKSEIENLKSKLKIDFEENIYDFFESSTYQLLIDNECFRETYENVRKNSKELIRSYFQAEGMYEHEVVALVDVGWKGTMQSNIFNILEGQKKCNGYYIGTTDRARSTVSNRKYGLIFCSEIKASRDWKEWQYDAVFLERILWASHDPTNGYQRHEGRVIPTFMHYECENQNYLNILPVQEVLIDKFEKIDSIITNSSFLAEDFYEMFLEKHVNTIFDVNLSQIELQKQMYDNQIQNFGNINPAKECNNDVLGMKNVLKKAIKKLYLLKNTEVVFRILLHHNKIRIVWIIYHMKKNAENRKLKRNFRRMR